MRFSILKASLAVAAYCQVALGQALSVGEVTGIVNHLNKQAQGQITSIALFNETSREEYIRDRQGPLAQLLTEMSDSVSHIRAQTQGASPGGEAEQKELASSYRDMTGTHIQMLGAFVDKATTLWAGERVPTQVGIRIIGYRGAVKNLGTALPNYAPSNATELRDLAALLDGEFAATEAALADD